LSWVRTSTALIGFGFTIVQFFHSNLIVANAVPIRHPEMPRYMGLALIAAGVLALLVALLASTAPLHAIYWEPRFCRTGGTGPGAGRDTDLCGRNLSVADWLLCIFSGTDTCDLKE